MGKRCGVGVFFLVGLGSLLFFGAGPSSALAATELKIAYDTPPTTSSGIAVERFKGEVEKASQGELRIRIYHSGALGKAIQILEGVRAGAIEMFIGGFSPLTSFDERLAVLDLPFLIRNWEHGENVLNSPVTADMNDKFLKKTSNMRILGWATSGFQGFYNSKRPILSLEDIKGLKMRTMESPIKLAAMNAYGAKAIAMAFPEFYPAMQQGVVDGGENAIETYQTAKHYEVAKYYTKSNHVLLPTLMLVGERTFQRLSPKNQQILLSSGATTMREIYKTVWGDTDRRLEIAQKAGAELYRLKPGEREKFEKAVALVYEKLYTRIPELRETVGRIQAIK